MWRARASATVKYTHHAVREHAARVCAALSSASGLSCTHSQCLDLADFRVLRVQDGSGFEREECTAVAQCQIGACHTGNDPGADRVFAKPADARRICAARACGVSVAKVAVSAYEIFCKQARDDVWTSPNDRCAALRAFGREQRRCERASEQLACRGRAWCRPTALAPNCRRRGAARMASPPCPLSQACRMRFAISERHKRACTIADASAGARR
jgi:hypothetical protein